jgi:hypothetical protein
VKVAINKCYGGFGLSIDAVLWLLERGSDLVERIPARRFYGGDNEQYWDHAGWEKRWRDDLDRATVLPNGMRAHRWHTTLFDGDDILHENARDYDRRAHPDLIACIEALGDKANGTYAQLQIVEIPDDVGWEVDEYDGLERIAESHRVWG